MNNKGTKTIEDKTQKSVTKKMIPHCVDCLIPMKKRSCTNCGRSKSVMMEPR